MEKKTSEEKHRVTGIERKKEMHSKANIILKKRQQMKHSNLDKSKMTSEMYMGNVTPCLEIHIFFLLILHFRFHLDTLAIRKHILSHTKKTVQVILKVLMKLRLIDFQKDL